MTRFIAAIMAAAVLAGAALAVESTPIAAESKARPRVEVVFVLDTTGSMGGLIAAAKQKIWAIANTMATADPVPDIRMGLVAYRDRGDAYITKCTPLTADLDAVYADLMAFNADGGGDTPESVNQALHEAVTLMGWSRDAKVYRVIFLVGDCPPHMDYQDDVKYEATCKAAARAGIVVNTIQCGNHGATTPIWQAIALGAEGKFFQVAQDGGAVLASTPHDARLAELSRKLEDTRIYYGDAATLKRQADRDRVADSISAAAPVAALARRAVFNASEAGAENFAGEKELVSDIAAGKASAADLKDDVLPEHLKKLSPKEREKFIAKQAAERTHLQAEIKELAAKRQSHLEAEAKKTADKPSLDAGIFDCVRQQAAPCGMALEKGPAY